MISSISNPFCGDCSRVRLTAEGKLFTCLFGDKPHNIKDMLRSSDSDDTIRDNFVKIWENRDDKYSENRVNNSEYKVIKKAEMSYIGG